MKTIEYRSVDKSDWGDGAWQQEPDKKQWQDEATGLPCLIVRGPGGALCGYVGVAPGHPLHGKDYSDCVFPDRHEDHEKDGTWHYNCAPQGVLEAHGGITFAHGCAEIDQDAWARAKVRYEKAEAEAKKFRHGDSAEFLRDVGPVIGSFETWAEYQRGRTICHIGAPGEPDHVWWFGFDCAHLGDYSPKCERRSYSGDDVYRTLEYVTEQVTSLAAQLAKLSA